MVGPFEGIAAQRVKFGKSQRHKGFSPDIETAGPLLHEVYLPLVIAQCREITAVNAVTIPQGAHDALPGAGGWHDGTWIVEWARPLRADNLYDLQLTDLDVTYPFRVKVFEGQAGQPDPISEVVHLGFRAVGEQ